MDSPDTLDIHEAAAMLHADEETVPALARALIAGKAAFEEPQGIPGDDVPVLARHPVDAAR